MKKERHNQLPGWSKLILWISVSLTIIGTASAQEANVTDCDLLAAHPSDPGKIASGVDFEELDADTAIKACKEAVALEPESSRLIFQYGRALHKGKNYVSAFEHYRKVANLGHAVAQNYLGYMYMVGNGVAVDLTEAAIWYRKAAEQGQVNAQLTLGTMYDSGKGVTKNSSEAAKWYRKAADQGNAIAQFNIGYMYYHGKGVPVDYSEAMMWYRKAADQGYADAQLFVGIMYNYGDGVVKNLNKARKWAEKAKKSGSVKAEELLVEIDKEEALALKNGTLNLAGSIDDLRNISANYAAIDPHSGKMAFDITMRKGKMFVSYDGSQIHMDVMSSFFDRDMECLGYRYEKSFSAGQAIICRAEHDFEKTLESWNGGSSYKLSANKGDLFYRYSNTAGGVPDGPYYFYLKE